MADEESVLVDDQDEFIELVEDDGGGWCAVCGDLLERGQEVAFRNGKRSHVDDLDDRDCSRPSIVAYGGPTQSTGNTYVDRIPTRS